MTAPRLQFLGTGTAFHEDGRGSQCILVHPAAGSPFLVDLGPTAMAGVMRYGVDSDPLERLFVTHLHGDHVAGWPFLLLHLNFIDRRQRPFDVHGPLGVRDCLEGLMALCYPDVVEDPKLGFEVRYHELPVGAGEGLRAGETSFDVLPMDHHPTSIGYCFDVDGTRVGISGDTRWCDDLERLARASDVLLLECSSVRPHPHAHVSLGELRSGIDRLGDCAVVLIHLTDEVAAALAADPIARVSASHDGLVYPL
jgi:ribonuclease BN (tRNA processing enzyme)